MNTKFKIYSLTITLFLMTSMAAQKQIEYTGSACVQCNMVIKDDQFSARAVTKKGSISNFDAIECLVNFLKVNDDELFSELWVANYAKPGDFINAQTAFYLKSERIESPMGAGLAAFIDLTKAKTIQRQKGGELYSWEQLKSKFSLSKVGQANHEHHDHFRPDAYAPIGVMGDHLHEKKGLMVSLRTMNMFMNGNRSGSETITNSTIYDNYMVAPQEMNMQMYMLGAMYAPSDRLTLMLMQNIIKKDMDLKARMVMNEMVMFEDFSTSSSGFGDMTFSALYGIYNNQKTSLHLNGGLTIPVGNITKGDDTPMMDDARLPYAMQLGSGTIDANFGLTFKGISEIMSWGIQPLVTIRTGKNNEDYRLGNQYQLNLWGAYKLSNVFSVSSRLLGVIEGELNGRDPQLNPMMVTTANSNNYGYSKVRGFIGTNVAFAQTSIFKDLRLGLEAGIPVYRDYNGIQMNEELTINVGLRYVL